VDLIEDHALLSFRSHLLPPSGSRLLSKCYRLGIPPAALASERLHVRTAFRHGSIDELNCAASCFTATIAFTALEPEAQKQEDLTLAIA
jgi:hypothetical protein